MMNGAEAALRTAAVAGVSVCFANPGTTEMPLVAALDEVSEMRAVLCLFEGVCTGAADGYARIADGPALTLLHLGVGLGNGIANLHNARRARTPIVNIVGEHATWHLPYDPPLASDIETLARPVSSWVETPQTPNELPDAMARAIGAARARPNGIATLIAPADAQWGPSAGPVAPSASSSPAAPEPAALRRAVEALRGDGTTAILLGGRALRERGLAVASRVAAATGCTLLSETFPARAERGAGVINPERLPYFPEMAIKALAGVQTLILAGASEPIAFFGYENTPSRLTPEGTTLLPFATPGEDVEAALEALAEELGAPASAPVPSAPRPEGRPRGPLTGRVLAEGLASVLPEGAIISDESGMTAVGTNRAMAAAPRHSLLYLTGGGIGQAIPVAVGAAVAAPDRRVVAIQGDGGGMYTLQALWTAAREELNLTVIICANRRYDILRVELARAGVQEPGPGARALTDLAHPEIDWSLLAHGMGVPATRADTAEEYMAALERALSEPGPRLIEARV